MIYTLNFSRTQLALVFPC